VPRYFLNIVSPDGCISDENGSEHPDDQRARDEAIASIRGMISEDVKMSGRIDLRGRIEITDEQRVIREVVSFASTIVLFSAE